MQGGAAAVRGPGRRTHPKRSIDIAAARGLWPRSRVAGLLLAAIVTAGCSNPSSKPNATESAGEPWFEDVTQTAGINFVHVRATQIQYWLPEITGSGAAWIDFDGDGDLDLYLVQAGQLDPKSPPGTGNVLYENQGNGTFRDVTARTGVGDRRYGMGASAADYDSDGDEDLFVTNVNSCILYRNRGDGTFEDVTTAAGIDFDGWGSSAAFADYDADGDLDLFLVSYLRWSPEIEFECRSGANQRDYCDPDAYEAPTASKLYRNRGDGTFEDVSEEVGISSAVGNGLGVTVADFNLDGRLDYYVANDRNPNRLWIQDAAGHFQDHAMLAGCAVDGMGKTEAGMGVAAVDVDQDGDLDIFVTNLVNEASTLYIYHNGLFADATAQFGLSAPSLSYTGFGLGFADFDHDGNLDVYVANGRVIGSLTPLVASDVYAEPDQLFRGSPDHRFTEVMPRGGTDPILIETSRGCALGDYNGDGSVDVLVVNNGGPARLLANRAARDRSWIRLRIRDHFGNDALGARVRIDTRRGSQWRNVQRTYSIFCSHEPQVHFGLDREQQVDRVTIYWVAGVPESFGPLSAGQTHELRQGQGKSVSAEPPGKIGGG